MGFQLENLKNVRMVPNVHIVILDIALKEGHASSTAGHFGLYMTLVNVKRRFLWMEMRKEVELFVKICKVCQ